MRTKKEKEKRRGGMEGREKKKKKQSEQLASRLPIFGLKKEIKLRQFWGQSMSL